MIKTIHSTVIDKKFKYLNSGEILFEDKVKYSKKEIDFLRDNKFDNDEKIAIHNIKLLFGGSEINIISDENPIDQVKGKLQNACNEALKYYNSGFVMPFSISKAAKEAGIEIKEISHVIGKYAAWIKARKKRRRIGDGTN